jgi:MSHA biogenesis protein MshP
MSGRRPQQAAAWCPRDAGGFALVAAIFLLLIIAALGAFAMNLTAGAHATAAVAVHGARAYEAARAGIEWAAYQIRDPNGTLAPGATNLPDCFASPTPLALPAAMGDFTVEVSCTRHPDFGASPNFHEEGSKRLAVYVVTSTASAGTPGAADYVERRLEARIEKCKDPDAALPAHSC